MKITHKFSFALLLTHAWHKKENIVWYLLAYKTLKITDDNTLMWSIAEGKCTEEAMISGMMKNVGKKVHVDTTQRLISSEEKDDWDVWTKKLFQSFLFYPQFPTSNVFKTLTGSNFFTRLFCLYSRFAYEILFIILTHSQNVRLPSKINISFFLVLCLQQGEEKCLMSGNETSLTSLMW